jgi:signal peptidase II
MNMQNAHLQITPSESYFHGGLATMFPPEGGYGNFLTGKVVDMLYFPIVDTQFPEGLPLVGGKPFKFFNAIFNVADVAISTGVGILIVFNKKAFTPGTN